MDLTTGSPDPDLAVALMALFDMASDNERSLSSCWNTLVQAGRQLLGVRVGLVTAIDGERLNLMHANAEDGGLQAGQRIDIQDAFCGLPLSRGHVIFCPDVRASEFADHPAVESLRLWSYAGVPLFVDNRAVGTLCLFSQGEPPTTTWTEAHRDVLVMMGRWLSHRQEKETHRALLREKERGDLMLRALFDEMREMAGFIAPDGTMVAVNKATVNAVAPDGEQILGLKAWECPWIRDEQQARRLEQAVADAAGGRLIRYTENIAVASSQTVPIDFSLTPIRDASGTVSFLLAEGRDLSLALAEERRQQAVERKVQESQKLESLGVLAGGIAHDFNNLLTGILGNASLARADLPPRSALAKPLREIENAARSSADLCQQLLAYSGRSRFVVAPLDLTQLVADCTELLKLSIAKSTLLRLELHGEPSWIRADPTQLKQVLMNLIINASESLGGGPGRVTVSIGQREIGRAGAGALDLDATRPGPHISLVVADDGCGMSEEVRRQIFEPFYSTKFTGRGLGLAVVQGIVRAHDGGLRVASTVGEGTTIELLFPVIDPPSDDARQVPDTGSLQPRLSGKALVIDDTPGIGRVIRLMLGKLGISTVEATDGVAGVEMFTQHRDELSLVLLDLTMPNMDGHATYQALREQGCVLPVVMMSGFSEHEISQRFAGDDIAAFLQKPISFNAIKNALASVAAPVD